MIITNGKVITNDKNSTFYDNGAVYIKDNIIVDVGNSDEIKKHYKTETILDAKGGIILPGFICTHSHIYSAYARGISVTKPTDNFFNVLENLWWSLDSKLKEKDVELNALTTYIDSIMNGVTTVIDHHSGPQSLDGSLFIIAEAAKKLGIRTSLCYEVTDRYGDDVRDRAIKENIAFIKDAQKNESDMIKGLFGLHASFTVSDETLYKVREAMEGVYDGYHIHVAEGLEDELLCLKKYKKRIVNRLFDFDILGERTIAAHCVHINAGEMDILKKTNTNVVHNPESNMNNAVGTTNVLKLLEKGIVVGLGTDAYTNDMYESMKVAKILMSHEASDPTVGFAETKQMQFTNNPIILSKYFNKNLGVIEKGAYADIAVAEYNPPTPMHKDNWFGHLVFGLSGKQTIHTVINGKIVMKDREVLGIDVDKIMSESRIRAAEIWKEM
ncbi:putative aminohydrolase SsnA [Treponema phagedenis]|uniref:putative aminohydrolase SsnA n=1 Tax=Treponema phagedenis TaxID=162 RepID=UPI0002F08BF7|nr:putative aminohydrolase SsnA [Treponema phagedenis]TYT78288.1 putative aminohydrolase SsnA [Treponema phagedenis]